MLLQSEHIYLRALEPQDLDFLYTLENNSDIWAVSNTSAPYSRFVLQQYLENAAADIYAVRQLRLVVVTNAHEPAGAIDLFDFEPLHRRAGIGITILPEKQGRSFATEALQLIENYVIKVLNLHQLYCSVTETNKASLALFRKAGYSEIGIRKDWQLGPEGWENVIEFQKILTQDLGR